MGKRAWLIGAVALALVAALGLYVGVHEWNGRLPLRLGSSCTVQANGEVKLDPDQMANAATIAAAGIRRKLPERAVVVALATAFQESKLRNLAHGDRDSLGLFQQRPSKGWGTPEQIRDPRYAAGKFYDALRKVRGWEQMRITEAAQRVQRSAHPTAYEKWAEKSTVLATALIGQAGGAVACALRDEPTVRGAAAATGLTESLALDWGKLNAVTSPRQPGMTVTVGDAQVGWQYAHWIVAHAAERGVKRVVFGNRQWTADEGDWTTVSGAASAGRVVADVFADA